MYENSNQARQDVGGTLTGIRGSAGNIAQQIRQGLGVPTVREREIHPVGRRIQAQRMALVDVNSALRTALDRLEV